MGTYTKWLFLLKTVINPSGESLFRATNHMKIKAIADLGVKNIKKKF